MAVILNGDAGVTTTAGAEYNGLQRQIAQNANNANNVTYSNIPDWVRRITLQIFDLSLSTTVSTSSVFIRVGDANGIRTTGYNCSFVASSSTGNTVGNTTSAIGLISVTNTSTAISGQYVLTNLTGDIWIASGMVLRSGDNISSYSNGTIDFQGNLRLSQVRIQTANGFNFDSGLINIIYE